MGGSRDCSCHVLHARAGFSEAAWAAVGRVLRLLLVALCGGLERIGEVISAALNTCLQLIGCFSNFNDPGVRAYVATAALSSLPLGVAALGRFKDDRFLRASELRALQDTTEQNTEAMPPAVF